MKESLSGFSFERDSRPFAVTNFGVEEKEFAGHRIGYCFTDFMA